MALRQENEPSNAAKTITVRKKAQSFSKGRTMKPLRRSLFKMGSLSSSENEKKKMKTTKSAGNAKLRLRKSRSLPGVLTSDILVGMNGSGNFDEPLRIQSNQDFEDFRKEITALLRFKEKFIKTSRFFIFNPGKVNDGVELKGPGTKYFSRLSPNCMISVSRGQGFLKAGLQRDSVVHREKIYGKKKEIDICKLPDSPVEQKFRYVAVLDFEATCDNVNPPMPQEIIEFPVMVIDTKTFEICNKFHHYCKPIHHPKLRPFCTELTGINQKMVDPAEDFPTVWKDFIMWVQEAGYTYENTIFLSCGNWDLKTMLPNQANVSGIKVPKMLKQWINIKILFKQNFNVMPKGMMGMLKLCHIEHVGRHHSGIDDVRNIANCAVFFMQKGVLFKPTQKQA